MLFSIIQVKRRDKSLAPLVSMEFKEERDWRGYIGIVRLKISNRSRQAWFYKTSVAIYKSNGATYLPVNDEAHE